MKGVCLLLAFASVASWFLVKPCALHAASHPLPQPYEVAVLRILNKVSARVQTMNIPVGGQAVVGTLRLSVLSCTQMTPEEEPQTAAYLQVYNDAPNPLFSGFIYAQSPSLNGLENPFYDIWLDHCAPAEPS